MLELNKIHNMNCLEGLKLIDDGIINTCITSPPYWGLRDYGIVDTHWTEVYYSPMPGMSEIYIPKWEGCLGLEPSIEMFIGHIVLIFREVKRALRNDGTVWLNFGDSYIGTGGNRNKPVKKDIFNQQQSHNPKEDRYERIKQAKENGLKPKDLAGVPWRVAFALQADGWYLRSDIIWHKLSCMPEAVKDRPTKCHEYMFLLAKSQNYYYDHQAIKEPCSSIDKSPPRGSVGVIGPLNQGRRAKGNSKTFRGGGVYTKGRSFNNATEVKRESHGNKPNETGLRNKRTVWSLGPEQFREAHFATFPTKLVEPCILAGSKKNDIVLDPFMGSGTVAQKALELQRRFIGFEIKGEYIDLARKRRLAQVQMKMV